MNALLLIGPGAAVGLGLFLVVVAFRPRHPRLADALGVLAEDVAPPPVTDDAQPSGAERLGAWWLRSYRVVVGAELERNLRLRGRSVSQHYTHKVLGGVAGLLLPVLAVIVVWVTVGEVAALPALASPILGVVGFILPDVLLRGASAEATEDATESLLTFFDLVTLERLANQSGTQALQAAAALSDAPVFAAIRATLERARLQQRAPYADLKALGQELELPALRDLADVMRLDESGASLSLALRARVRELRDAHLNALKITATEGSERMTLWMVVPSLAFALFFLIPPLLTLVTSG
ncbi:MAG: hypothetical protein Q4F65_10755 [Propionibacteriaceae bacterium]|nr:hypothetical protein [Propionibacteriaceae bacterium]